MLIDTSRNGWGGAARPTGPGATTSVDTYVDGGRYDRRIHAGNWCNQSGAGLGERPKAAPGRGHRRVRVGEAAGRVGRVEQARSPTTRARASTGCATRPTRGNPRNGNNMSGALPDAPLSGHWFSAQFRQLMQNAYPPLS